MGTRRDGRKGDIEEASCKEGKDKKKDAAEGQKEMRMEERMNWWGKKSEEREAVGRGRAAGRVAGGNADLECSFHFRRHSLS